MENSPENKRPSLKNSEIQSIIFDNKKQIEETESLIKESFHHIKEGIDILEGQTAYLDHMEREKQFLDLEEDIIGKRGAPKYSEEEINTLKLNIDKIRSDIKKLESDVSEMSLNKITLDYFNDQFLEFENHLNKIILRIDKYREN